jgi:hypothetical protein
MKHRARKHSKPSHRKPAHRVRARVAGGARKLHRKARSAFAGARKRYSARRAHRNPKGFLGVPAVRLAAAAIVGVGVGYALENMTRPAWWPEAVPMAVAIGAAVATVGYMKLKGQRRELAIAAGLGIAGAGIVPKISEALGPMISGSPTIQVGAEQLRIARLSAPRADASGYYSKANAAALAVVGSKNRNLL